MKNFTTSLNLGSKDDQIYKALTNHIRDWWTEMFEGSAEEVGNTFTIRFGSQVFKTMRVEELIQNRKVAWRVNDALIDLPDLVNKEEWINTVIVWDIWARSDGADLRVTHIGLTPDVECFELCSNGWNSFLYSLKNFITSGLGSPFTLAESD